jgi:hypothetical protein
MRRHLDFLDSRECARRIEWRKCSILESRTHCVLKFARKFFDEIAPRAIAKRFFEKFGVTAIGNSAENPARPSCRTSSSIRPRSGRSAYPAAVTNSTAIEPGCGASARGVDAAFAVV